MALGDGITALASLGVTFGGFSPTLMDGVETSKDMVRKFEEISAKRKEAKRRQRELEFARTSPERRYFDSAGDEWSYVTVDDSVVRIVKYLGTARVVRIPAEIEGKTVYALSAEALSENEAIEEIVCPDCITSIGPCAFRYNANLKRVVLPSGVSEFQDGWIRECSSLEELILPGLLDHINLHVFSTRSLKRLVIGSNVFSIEPGAFQNSTLESITIADDNPFLITDGVGIYTSDGKTLLALACPVSEYRVVEGCCSLGRKSCYGVGALKRIVLPDTVQELDPFALSHSGVCSFEAPASLRSIGEKSFYYCRDLTAVKLNDGLASIGDSAFEETSLNKIHIPASIEHIGSSVTARSNVIHSGPDCTFEIDDCSGRFFIDGAGGLYRNAEDGAHLVQLIDNEASVYSMECEAVAVDAYAFAYHDAIRRVIIADGVRVIGNSAFRICRSLEHVELPDSVREIGDGAFLDTSLVDFRVPASLEKLGKNALVTYNAHHGQGAPSLVNVEVALGNERFYMASGMLCRRDAGGSAAVLFTNSESQVVFPEEITRIEEFAFNNARGIDYLSLNPGIKTIGTAGLTTWCWIRHIHVELAEELEGRRTYDFFFPDTMKGVHGISNGIGGSSWVNVPAIMAQYDNCIVNARDYNARNSSDNISAYEQAKLILGRLNDPIMLTEVNRGMFERLLRIYICEICVDIARHDDRAAMDELVERGFVNADNLDAIIERVGRLQDAAMTAHLLEVKRLRFGGAIIDFDL